MRLDSVRTVEYGEAPEDNSGARKLLARLLLLAIMDALERREPRRKAVYLQHYRPDPRILAWIKSPKSFCSPEQGVSFAWVCEQLDLPPEELRNAVLTQRVALIRSTRSPLGFFLIQLPDDREAGQRSATSGFTSDTNLGAVFRQRRLVPVTGARIGGARVSQVQEQEKGDA
jgi:hypothetical protein